MDQPWTRLAEVSNQIDLIEITLAAGELVPEAEAALRRELDEARRELVELERKVGLRRDPGSG